MQTSTPLFVLLLMLAGCSPHQPNPTPVQTRTTPMVPTFSGKSAFDYLTRQVDFGPRNPNSSGHAACLEYLVSALRASADTVSVQSFSHEGYEGEQLALSNVIASFHPGLSDRILLCAHWDTRPRAERDEVPGKQHLPMIGANDGASGVAVLLELAKLFKQSPPPIGVDIVLFDGEDYGKEGDLDRYLLGARHFADTKPGDYVPRFGILLDMIGDAHLEIPQERNSLRFAADVVELVWGTARQLGVSQFVAEPGEELYDDHIPLNNAGIKTIDLIDFNYPDFTNRFWHTHQDTPEHCSAESLEAVGSVLAHVVYGMATNR